MNIFFLDDNPKIAAEYHCDKHVIKMILESAQMLSTAHRVLDGKQSIVTINNRKRKVWTLPNKSKDELLYSATHINHPSTKWVMESPLHYLWLYKLMNHLNDEYKLRYKKSVDHFSITKLNRLLAVPPTDLLSIPEIKFKPAPQCMPNECKIIDDTPAAYKNYYIAKKSDIAAWRNGKIPNWFNI